MLRMLHYQLVKNIGSLERIIFAEGMKTTVKDLKTYGRGEESYFKITKIAVSRRKRRLFIIIVI